MHLLQRGPDALAGSLGGVAGGHSGVGVSIRPEIM